MSLSNENEEFTHYILDLMQGVGPVISKRMFGGYGIFIDGLMFAIISDGLLYLKVDSENEMEFISRHSTPFTYLKKGKTCKLSYYQSPEEALEEVDIMFIWANSAYAAARRAAAKKLK